MSGASVWIIEYRRSGDSIWHIAETRTTKEVAERWVSKKHFYNSYEYRVVEYRRVEPAPETPARIAMSERYCLKCGKTFYVPACSSQMTANGHVCDYTTAPDSGAGEKE